MKRNYLLLALSLLLLCFSACKKEDAAPADPTQPPVEQPTVPRVTLTPVELATDAITAHFAMNPLCTSYTILLAEVATRSQWMPPTADGLRQAVLAWGLTYTTDTTYTWTEQAPATDYVIYVVAQGKTSDQRDTSILDSLAVRTATAGGSGQSVIAIQVSDITSTSARVICTPNDQTALYKDMLITVDAYNTYGQDSVIAMLKADPYTQYATDNWVWQGLQSGTAYYALAIGQNAIGQWGPLALQTFTTASAK